MWGSPQLIDNLCNRINKVVSIDHYIYNIYIYVYVAMSWDVLSVEVRYS